MKIMWHSGAPWEPTGYGTQTAIWTSYLAKQGHEVILSARTSLMYAVGDHGGLPVLPRVPFEGPGMGDESLPMHAIRHKPDLIIVLYDLWSFGLTPDRLPQDVPVACWLPVDCTPPDQIDRQYLASGRIYPIAMSEFGRDEIRKLGYACGYVPHGINTKAWSPLPAARDEIRNQFQIPKDAFVIGINGTSTDPDRKGLWEQMAAFAVFHRRHPNSVLMLHTLNGFAHGFNTAAAGAVLGIDEAAIRTSPNYEYLFGGIPGNAMINWYNALDVLSNCSHGEGFGLAAVEAQACGTPVILSDNSTGRQLVGPGWLVKCQPKWQSTHGGRWGIPIIGEIVKAYEKAYKDAAKRREAAWEFAAAFDVETVGPMWEPVLKEATGR